MKSDKNKYKHLLGNHQAETVEAKAATAEVQALVGKKNLPPLTRKQAAFVKELIENPKQSGAAAARKVYNIGVRGSSPTASTAGTVASENMKKPAVMAWLQDRAERAEQVVSEVMEYSVRNGKKNAAYAGIAQQTANSILDRVHGKATQRTEVTSTAVGITIDLTGSMVSDSVNNDESA